MGGNACFKDIIKLSTSLQVSYCLCYTILCTEIASYVPRGYIWGVSAHLDHRYYTLRNGIETSHVRN